MVVAEDPEELVSIEISQENVSKRFLKLNLLENLVYDNNSQTRVQLVTHQLERAFVEYCFESSKMPGQEKIIKIEKVQNKSVQRRFMNELVLVQEKNKNKSLD